MHLDKQSVNLGKSFEKFLDDCIPSKKPLSLSDDKRFMMITTGILNTMHTVEKGFTEMGFYSKVEHLLKSLYDIDMEVQEFSYIMKVIENISKPAMEKIEGNLKNNSSHIQ